MVNSIMPHNLTCSAATDRASLPFRQRLLAPAHGHCIPEPVLVGLEVKSRHWGRLSVVAEMHEGEPAFVRVPAHSASDVLRIDVGKDGDRSTSHMDDARAHFHQLADP